MTVEKKPTTRVLSDHIYDELEARIIDRTYPPGFHLVEDEVAEDLGVSRTPVREAFKALQRAGWLETRPHLGAYVRLITFEEVRDVFEVREWLEERVARVAAERISPQEIQSLRKIIARAMKVIAKKGGKRPLASLNAEFHDGLAAACGNALLVEMVHNIVRQVHRHFSAVAEQRGEDAWHEHESILDAVERGDADEAARLIVDHSRKTQEAFLDHLSSHQRSWPARAVG